MKLKNFSIEYIGVWTWIPKKWISDGLVICWGYWIFRYNKKRSNLNHLKEF